MPYTILCPRCRGSHEVVSLEQANEKLRLCPNCHYFNLTRQWRVCQRRARAYNRWRLLRSVINWKFLVGWDRLHCEIQRSIPHLT